MKTAIILAGHGSHISPNTAGIVWQQVDILRGMGIADEITAAFWKEMPSFATVFNTLTADDITIVPLFTAQGYFTRSVIPAEMQLKGAITHQNGRTMRYARTLGEHRYIRQIVQRRVQKTLENLPIPPQQVGVALIGHGTKRNPESRAATEDQAQFLRDTGLVGEVTAVYLDDVPSIPDAYEILNTPYIIAVPNFLASGSHTTIDVPGELGLETGQTSGIIQGRHVSYTAPIGEDETLTQLIIELITDAGMSLYPRVEKSSWAHFPAKGRDVLLQTVENAGELAFGQLVLTLSEVRSGKNPKKQFDSPAALREHIRTIPHFRPLSSDDDLPQDWSVAISMPEMLHAVVETVYPGVVADWAAQQNGQFAANSLEKVIARQQGMFRALADFPDTEKIIENCCHHCILQPAWFSQQQDNLRLPCGEPCNLWLSRALEHLEA